MKKVDRKFDKEINIKQLKNKYAPDFNLILMKEDLAEIVKFIIQEKLDIVDRNIFLIYVDNDFNVKYLSKYFDCSDSLVYKKINEIKERIKKEVENFLG